MKNQEALKQQGDVIWNIANLLRGPYRPPQYRRVMIPLTVLRRLDCVLEATKGDVLAHYKLMRQMSKHNEETIEKTINHRFGLPLPLAYENKQNKGKLDLDPLLALVRPHCEAYLAAEVLPYRPDAWIDHQKTKVGYEIPFNRHFYEYKPPRPLAAIEQDIAALERDIVALLKEVTA